MPVDGGCRESEPFERARGARVTQRRARAKEFFNRRKQTVVLGSLRRCHAAARGVAVDAAPDEFGDEPSVADRFRTSLDEELREHQIVHEAVGFARFDRAADVIVRIAFLRKPVPELRLAETALRE